MADIIKLLPDSVANQIAAGEVIQRPASVVKELVENAVDAGGSAISILIKDAGKTSIQIVDNGCGMSATDARMAFERHATSKIRDPRDLFSIRTLGFRGEALASIAAISEVKLRTKRIEDELGTCIDISASRFDTQEPVSCANGSNFLVRNLFYNTPARRKFLKADTTELRHIVNEFQRIALTHPEIEFILHHNNVELYHLPFSNFRQRICNVFGKNMNQYLIPINADTSIVKISGLIGKPESAKKTFGEQFFFVNQRFIRHPWLHKAVLKAYQQLLPPDALPAYFIYFEIDPEAIDINIHPTKTEVKFEDEQSIYQILLASLKEALGKFNIVPSLDFDMDTSISIPTNRKGEDYAAPNIDINPNFNPFETDNERLRTSYPSFDQEKETLKNWEHLYSGLESDKSASDPWQPAGFNDENDITESLPEDRLINTFQLKNKYILTPVKSGLMLIDQKRAHERILFERYIQLISTNRGIVQRSLFPEILELSPPAASCLMEIFNDIRALGFDLEFTGETRVQINGYPADLASSNPVSLLENMISAFLNETLDIETERKEKIAREMAQASAIDYGKTLSHKEMRELVDHLFACETPNYSPSGKNIISILNLDEIEKEILKVYKRRFLRMYSVGFNRYGSTPPVVKNLILINVVMLVATWALNARFGYDLTEKLGLFYIGSSNFRPYQLITHMFMHGGLTHIFFNMFALWMFGKILENVWGSKRFFFYYMVTGLGAAALHLFVMYLQISHVETAIRAFANTPSPELFASIVKKHFDFAQSASAGLIDSWSGDPTNTAYTAQAMQTLREYYTYLVNIPTVGASGAVYGVLLAFGMLFPNTELMLLFPPIPIKAKWIVIGYGSLELYLGITQPGSDIAHFAHLGGMLFGFILIKYWNTKRTDFY